MVNARETQTDISDTEGDKKFEEVSKWSQEKVYSDIETILSEPVRKPHWFVCEFLTFTLDGSQ